MLVMLSYFNQWGSLGPLIAETVSTLHADTRFWEKEKVLGFTEDAVNAGCVWVAFPVVCYFLGLVPSSGVFLQ